MAPFKQGQFHVTGLILQPSRFVEYDFTPDDDIGGRRTGSYFETDLVQATERGTSIVSVRSEYPIVERVEKVEPVTVTVQLSLWDGRVRCTLADEQVPAKPARGASA
jgi:hypothetical protein